MSQDDLFTAEPPPRQPGMSGSSKLLIGLGIGCGVVLVLCCGGFFVVGWQFQTWFAESMSEDPAEVKQSTSEITDLTIPEGFKPKAKMSPKIPFSDEPMMTMVIYESDHGGSLVLTQFGRTFAEGKNADQMERQLRESLKEQGRREEDIAPLESEDVDLEIRGKPASFTIQRGEDKQSEDEVWLVFGSFQGKEAPAMLVLEAKTTDMAREQIDELLNSIK